jgi:uncharacterized protein
VSIEVTDNPSAHRYEITADGELAGFVAYRRQPGRIVLRHTEIDDEYEGLGLGSHLARAVLDEARRHGEQVVPLCPFIAAYMRRHPEYADLT